MMRSSRSSPVCNQPSSARTTSRRQSGTSPQPNSWPTSTVSNRRLEAFYALLAERRPFRRTFTAVDLGSIFLDREAATFYDIVHYDDAGRISLQSAWRVRYWRHSPGRGHRACAAGPYVSCGADEPDRVSRQLPEVIRAPQEWYALRYGFRASGVAPACGPKPTQVLWLLGASGSWSSWKVSLRVSFDGAVSPGMV